MTKNLKIAIQMDPLEKLNLKGDTTFLLGLEALRRGFDLFYYSVEDLIYDNNKVYSNVKKLDLFIKHGEESYEYGINKVIDLSRFDVILMRQDPPFDMSYITATHLLEKLTGKTIVLNNPINVRNCPEKIFVTEFSSLMPKTMITRNVSAIKKFKKKHKEIILKPLYGNGGESVFRIKENDENFNVILESILKSFQEQIVVQQYLPEVKKGDKRIILIDGEVVGAINRIPAKNETRSNMHVGGRPMKTILTKNDLKICNAISTFLKKNDLFLVGIDIIGKYITEINVTSPTGLREINFFNNVNIQKIYWDKLLKKFNFH